MTTIKAGVKMLLVLFVLLGFSGCTEQSIQYITVPCKVEKPVPKAPTYSCNAKYPDDDYLYGKCLSEKILLLQSDYTILEKAFDACKE